MEKKDHSWALYRVVVKWSPWGKILYASSFLTASLFAKYWKGEIEPNLERR